MMAVVRCKFYAECNVEAGLEVITSAIQYSEQSLHFYAYPELWRLKGDFLWKKFKQSISNAPTDWKQQVDDCFIKAIESSHDFTDLFTRFKACLSRAQFWQQQQDGGAQHKEAMQTLDTTFKELILPAEYRSPDPKSDPLVIAKQVLKL